MYEKKITQEKKKDKIVHKLKYRIKINKYNNVVEWCAVMLK